MLSFVFSILCICQPIMALDAEFQIYPEGIESQLLEFSAASDTDSLLESIHSNVPELKILVVDLTNSLFSKDIKILWKDSSLTQSSYDFYTSYTSSMIQSVAYYLAPGAVMENSPQRPYLNAPVMVIKKNSPRQAIFHELAHFLIDKLQRENSLNLIDVDDENIFDLIHKISEEVYVDYLLIKHPESFGFNIDDICFRHKYLKQNLQVFKSLSGEIHETKESLSIKDQKTLTALYEFYGKAASLQHKYHTQCFLF